MKYFLVLIFTLMGCGSMTKNHVKIGEVTLSAFSENKSEINFKRVSWFQEIIMISDLWVSKGEDNCLLVLAYSKVDSPIEKRDLYEKLVSLGYDKRSASIDKKSLSLHPEYSTNFLNLYEFNKYCSKSKSSENLVFEFQGFKKIVLTP